MKYFSQKQSVLSLVIMCTCFSLLSRASMVLGFEEAVANATVQQNGNRPGNNGTNFFNVQNNVTPQFASYGVIEWNLGSGDFTTAPPALTGTEVGAIQVRLTQSNASFSRDTTLRFYLWNNFSPVLAPGNAEMTFDTSELTGISDPPQLWFNTPHTLWELGTGNYAREENGYVDQFSFYAMPMAARDHVANQLNTNGPLRIVVVSTRDDGFTGAATYAGITNNSFSGPELSITIIPEPGVLLSLLFGMIVVFGLNRRA